MLFKKVLSFVNCPRLSIGKIKSFANSRSKSTNVTFDAPVLLAFCFKAFQFLLLTDVSAESNDFGVIDLLHHDRMTEVSSPPE